MSNLQPGVDDLEIPKSHFCHVSATISRYYSGLYHSGLDQRAEW